MLLLHKNWLRGFMSYRTHYPFYGTGKMGLIQIKQAVRLLSLGQLRKLDEWLHDLIRRAEESRPSRKETLAERTLDTKTYRLEAVRCGKERCKCARGMLHGPY